MSPRRRCQTLSGGFLLREDGFEVASGRPFRVPELQKQVSAAMMVGRVAPLPGHSRLIQGWPKTYVKTATDECLSWVEANFRSTFVCAVRSESVRRMMHSN
jgi:hypothetical protein